MELNYIWEIKLYDGTTYREDTHRWKNVTDILNKVAQISLIPQKNTLPRHDIPINIVEGERLIRRFRRNFIRQSNKGFKLHERIDCIVTNRYRLWIFPDGNTKITNTDYELYI